MKKAAIYCRVSTEEQASDRHHSLDVQEQNAREFASQKGWAVTRVERDSASGKDVNRPGYQRVLSDVRAREIDVLILYKLDRLSRNVRDIYDCLQLLDENEVGLVCLTENYDTTHPMGRAFFGIAAVFAQLTREMIAENVRNALRMRASKGKVHPGRYKTYGYDYSPEQGYVPNPSEAEVVRRVFDAYVNRKLSLRQIAMSLNHARVPTKGDVQWSAAMVSKMLRNVQYVGKVRYNDEVFEGVHESLLDQDLFHAAQRQLDHNAALHPRTRTSKALLSGVARCGYCGYLLSPKKRGRGPDAFAYRCTGNQRTDHNHCPGVVKASSILDGIVLHRIRQLVETEEMQDLITQEVQRLLTSRDFSATRDEEVRLLQELEGIDNSFRRWADRLDGGIIDESQFALQNRRIMDRRYQVEKRLGELRTRLTETEHVGVQLDEVMRHIGDFPRIWEVGTLEERRAVVSGLLETLSVTREELILKLQFLPEERIRLHPRRPAQYYH